MLFINKSIKIGFLHYMGPFIMEKIVSDFSGTVK